MTQRTRTILFLLLLASILLASLLTTPLLNATTDDPQKCSLTVNRNRVSLTVSRGPCTIADFPVWCDAYVPGVITQGQTIRCEVVVVTATPTRQPTPYPTPTRLPLLEKLRRNFR